MNYLRNLFGKHPIQEHKPLIKKYRQVEYAYRCNQCEQKIIKVKSLGNT